MDYKAIELDLTEHGADIQNLLFKMTGLKTVPNIFIKEKSLGGSEALYEAYSSGKLLKMLQ